MSINKVFYIIVWYLRATNSSKFLRAKHNLNTVGRKILLEEGFKLSLFSFWQSSCGLRKEQKRVKIKVYY